MKIEHITNSAGEEITNIFYDDGSQVSMLKTTWDELEAAKLGKAL